MFLIPHRGAQFLSSHSLCLSEFLPHNLCLKKYFHKEEEREEAREGEGEYFTINFWRIQKTSVSGRVLGEKMVFLKMYQHVYFHLLSFISDTKRLG